MNLYFRPLFQAPRYRAFLFASGFVALSLLLHGLAISWLVERLDTPEWPIPIRDTPIEVSLSSASAVQPRSIPTAVTPKPQSIKPALPRKAVRSTAKANVPSESIPSPGLPASSESSATASPLGESAVVSAASELPSQTPAAPQQAPAGSEVPAKSAPEPPPEPKSETAALGADPLVEPPRYGKALGPLPKPGNWVYVFHYGEYSDGRVLGRAVFSLDYGQVQGQPTYNLKVLGKAEGLTSWVIPGEVLYSSEGLFTANGFAPLRYLEKPRKRPERSASVNYAEQKVTFGEQQKPIVKGLLDRISVMWQLGLLIANDSTLTEARKNIAVSLLSTRSLESAQFVSNGQEKLEYNGKSYQATHFKFQPLNSANKAQIDLWYDQTRLPLPIRVRWIDEKGETLDFFQREQ